MGLDEYETGIKDFTAEDSAACNCTLFPPKEGILEHLDKIIKIDMSSDVHRDANITRYKFERQPSYLPADVRELVIESPSRLAQNVPYG